MTVFDSSALLAMLLGEPGADVVEAELGDGEALVGAANWAEVAAKVRRGSDWGMARALLLSYGIKIVPVSADDAEAAAAMWRPGTGLSLGDRLCLALGERKSAEVFTADGAWGDLPRVRLIR